jgi:hypothetical protein
MQADYEHYALIFPELCKKYANKLQLCDFITIMHFMVQVSG